MSQFNDTPVKFWLGKQRTGVSIKSAGVTYEPPIPYFTGAADGNGCEATYGLDNGQVPPGGPNDNPSSAPTVPRLAGETTLTSVPIFFDTSKVTALIPLSFGYFYGTDPAALTTKVTMPYQPNPDHNATVSNLQIATSYYFASFSQTAGGILISAVGGPYSTKALGPNTPMQNPPTTPELSGNTGFTTITVTFNTSAVGGNPTPSFSLWYGTTPDRNTFIKWPYQPVATGAGNYVCAVNGLTQGTAYYFYSQARQGGEVKNSLTGGPYYTAGGPPSSAPTIPDLSGSPTTNSISVTINTSGIYGQTPITYGVQYGKTPALGKRTTTPSVIYGPFLTFTVADLSANTPYYFASDASNSIARVKSLNSPPYSTAGAAPAAPSAAPFNLTVPTRTNTSITIQCDTAGITGTPTPTYNAIISTVTPVLGTPVGLSPLGGTLQGTTFNDLSQNTNYFIVLASINSQGTKLSQIYGPIRTYTVPLLIPGTPTAKSSGAFNGNAYLTLQSVLTGPGYIPPTGNPPNQFEFLCDTVNPPVKAYQGVATLPPNPVMIASATLLAENTTYYVKARVYNQYGYNDSAIAQFLTKSS